MLRHTFTLALRHIAKRRIYSTIIVLSLTAGFTCTCLLVAFLVAESRVDSFHPNAERIVQVSGNDPFGGSGRLAYGTGELRDYLATNYPEVEKACLVASLPNAEIESAPGSFTSMNTISVDSTFFSLFDFPFISGVRTDVSPNSLFITERTALDLFGTPQIIGKSVRVRTPDSTRTLVVSGIIGEAPEQSHLRFQALVYSAAFRGRDGGGQPGGANYLLLGDHASAAALEVKINSDSLRPSLVGPGNMTYYLEPLSQSYFHEANRFPFTQTRSRTFLQAGWIVCGLILLMATFNFVNLVLLSMQERIKESGIKKTLGIPMWEVVRGTLLESSIYIGVSFALSLGFIYTLLPLFNSTLDTELATGNFFRFRVIGIVVAIVTVITFCVVLVSASFQLRVKPVNMIRSESLKVRVSKVFFTVQFFLSIILIFCAATIVRQMNFLENEPLGFNKNLVQVRLPGQEPHDRLLDLKNRVLQIPGVENAALSAGNPISGNMVARYEQPDGTAFTPYLFSGDGDLIHTLGLTVIEGKGELNQETDKLVNETLVRYFHFSNPVGQRIPGTEYRISGVVKDFTCSSFKQEIPPVIISFDPSAKLLLIGYNDDLTTVLDRIRTEWTSVFPDSYFDFKVLQQDLMKKYSEETQFYKVVTAAAIISMVISCFGLFALSWAVIRSRAREMGIRKVMGATAANILVLLTASFAKRLVVAFVLAVPVGYYLVDLWLARFAYKLPVDGWIFVITAATLAAIAIVTTGVQTFRASLSNPLREIRE